jgi:hypothetical protein
MLILPPGHGRAVSEAARPEGARRGPLPALTAVALLILAAGMLALVLGTVGERLRDGCLSVSFASATGAGTLSACGARARAECSALGTPGGYTGEPGRLIAQDCRSLHLPVGAVRGAGAR